MTVSHIVAFVLCLLAIQIYGYPSGAPKKLCGGSMVPHHHHLPPQPSSTSPITKFNTTWNADGETIASRLLLHLS
jgi:hypothetical protein